MNSSIEANHIQCSSAFGAEAISDAIIEAAIWAEIQQISATGAEAHVSRIWPFAYGAGINRRGRCPLDAAS